MREAKEDRRVRKTKKLYEDALIDLLQTKSINKISVTDLSEKVDMNRGTFYIHYEDIYDLLESIENRIIKELTVIAEKQLIENKTAFYEKGFTSIVAAMEYIQNNKKVIRVLLNEQGNLLFLSRIKKLFSEKLLNSFISVSSGLDQKHNNYFVSFFISGCTGIIQEWLKSDSDISVFELSSIIMAMLKKGSAI